MVNILHTQTQHKVAGSRLEQDPPQKNTYRKYNQRERFYKAKRKYESILVWR